MGLSRQTMKERKIKENKHVIKDKLIDKEMQKLRNEERPGKKKKKNKRGSKQLILYIYIISEMK